MSPRHEVLAEGVELWCGDCRELLPLIGNVGAVVTDPPYGIADIWKGGAGGKSSWRIPAKETHSWDQVAPDYIAEIVSDLPAIVWGGNYFSLPHKRGWLVWDKGIPDFTTGHSELAWTSIEQPIRNFRLCPNVMTPSGADGSKVHPTQKPVALMEWCIGFLPEDVGIILDPFMGSGTTGVAAIKRGKAFYGIEREPKYFDIALRRISDALKAPDMFIPAPAPKPKQESLI